MSVVAALLIAMTVTELPRLQSADDSRSERALPVRVVALAGVAALVLVVALTGGWSIGRAVLVLVGALALTGWLVTSRSTRTEVGTPALALLILGGGLLVLLAFAGYDEPVGGVWRDWLAHAAAPALRGVDPGHALMVLAVGLAQLGPANQVVRLVLVSTGTLRPPGQPQASDRLRGGRVLGPLERLLIVSLALAGQVTAAGFVTAAKGLIRFPELTAQRGRSEVAGVGIDAITEYFLIGSFVSWSLALGGVGLVALS